jgi:hypothetical protein
LGRLVVIKRQGRFKIDFLSTLFFEFQRLEHGWVETLIQGKIEFGSAMAAFFYSGRPICR